MPLQQGGGGQLLDAVPAEEFGAEGMARAGRLRGAGREGK
jgi:hypothetical protein